MLSLLCSRIREIHRNSKFGEENYVLIYIRDMTKVYRHGGVILFYGCVCNAGI